MNRPPNRKGANVLPVDGSYLYKVGAALKPLESIKGETLFKDAWLPLFIAAGELQTFINDSVYRISVRQSRENADALLTMLNQQSERTSKADQATTEFGMYEAYRLENALRDFQTVLNAEFRLTPLFLITPKRGYDISALVYRGNSLFPDSLAAKAPTATEDLILGARCLAFELWTASAFHLNRANEAVLRKYWDAKRPGKPHPGNMTISDYLRALGKSRKGSPRVKAALRDVKNLYRNPVLHPEIQVKNMDEAFAIMNAIHTAIVQMLDEIPMPANPAVAVGALTVAGS